MSVSDYGAQQWAAIMFGLAAPPSQFYVALCLAEPGNGWDGTVLASAEPSSSANYTRAPLSVPGDWVVSSAGAVVNEIDVVFPTPSLDWGVFNYFALTDAATGGNLWSYGRLLDPGLNVIAGAYVAVPVGGIQTGLANLLPAIVE